MAAPDMDVGVLSAPGLAGAGIRSRRIAGVNGLDMHILECGHEPAGRPMLLLLHGFPELAYSWRKVMPALAAAGYHVVAPDQRGYGLTTGWLAGYDTDLAPFRTLNLVRDALALAWALGARTVACVVGHDAGARVAAVCALARPDVFQRCVMMSAPFTGPPELPFATVARSGGRAADDPRAGVLGIEPALEALERPRQHYQFYYSGPGAATDMATPPEGLHAFLRAYYHVKSADWPDNRPFALAGWAAEELAKLPAYYVMDRGRTMPQSVAPGMPDADAVARCRWLPDAELAVYAAAYARTGFQGALNWYRCNIDPAQTAELSLFAGRTIDVPALFIAGASDWGIEQAPGALERMRTVACTRMGAIWLIGGAGHWVQQEQPGEVSGALLRFLDASATPGAGGRT